MGVGGCCVIEGRRCLFPGPAPSTGAAAVTALGPLLCLLSSPGLLLRLCLASLPSPSAIPSLSLCKRTAFSFSTAERGLQVQQVNFSGTLPGAISKHAE